jgi:hypothetical protein
MNILTNVVAALTNELRRPKYRTNPNPLAGHCYIASEALYWLLGGPDSEWHPRFVRHEGDSHWYLQHRSGEIADLTASQFRTPVPYAAGRRQAFLTRVPSKRAQIVIDRVRSAL